MAHSAEILTVAANLHMMDSNWVWLMDAVSWVDKYFSNWVWLMEDAGSWVVVSVVVVAD